MAERILIVGLGSIGRRHLECLREIRPTADITIWRQHHRNTAIPEGANRVVFDLKSALASNPECAIVANPASLHVDTAISLAEAGIHLLVEKPLSDSMKDVDRLISFCEMHNLVLMVAYVLRFNEGLNVFRKAVQDGMIGRMLSFRAEVGQYLPDWRPGCDYKNSVSARKDLGGGALLELSHELDYIRWIFGEVRSVSALMINSGVLDIDVEDIVEAVLEIDSQNGAPIVGSVHLDMVQRATCRSCRVIGETGVLEWDAIDNSVRYYNGVSKQWEDIYHAPKIERNALFIEQIESFLAAVRSDQNPPICGGDGKAVLQVIQGIREAAEQNIKVYLQ